MTELLEAQRAIGIFLETGGDVLLLIMFVTFALWLLILERFYFNLFQHRKLFNDTVAKWEARQDKKSWYASQYRTMLISQAKAQIEANVSMIKTLVAMAPLLGLLGTVTGMVEVFDVMAVLGSGNARAMASGVSKATIPTMSGMVVAISGLYFSFMLRRRADREVERLSDTLVQE
ncbi:MotA/TolQ/ExbB proton channel family protein [Rhodocista pekingensis]|uniref:MotA/TolQ/ExbB proton channel family protein n=1 Tax=Rhodocista pekingensis TaxID=201185 RepID=A0ABW2KQR6_9PROT